MKLVLVRHGETEWNKLGKFQGHFDIGMNARGKSQARETAQAVAEWRHTRVYSSPLSRTMEMAQEISQRSGSPVVPVPGFKELNLGDLEGITGEEMRTGWPEVYAAWREDPAPVSMPNGESLVQLQDRAWNSLSGLLEAHAQDESLVVVSHNFTIRAIIAKVLDMPLSSFHRMSLSLSSICTVDSDHRGQRLMTYNSTCHLSPENR
jgi:broad specificity phosphatase PhoE